MAKLSAQQVRLGATTPALEAAANGGLQVQVDGSSIQRVAGGVEVKDLGVSTAKLAANAVTAAKAKLDEVWAFTALPSANADPSGANDLARKSYVDAVASGLDVKKSVRVATAAALPAYTRTGNVITASVNGALAAVDGVTLVLNDRLLLQHGAAGSDNGPYYVSQVGTAGTPYTLTRTTDADSDAEVTSGMFTFVEEGTANADAGFVLTTNDPITLNTTALSFTQFSGAGQITAGAGLTKTGNTLDVGAGNGIQVNVDSVEAIYGLVGDISGNVDAGDAAAAGVLNKAARADHQHAVSTAAPIKSEPAQAGAAGTATTLARSDHQHSREIPVRDEVITTQAITTDVAMTDTIVNADLIAGTVELYLNGMRMVQGAGKDYTVAGQTITWLAGTGTAPDMTTSDEMVASYTRSAA